MPPRETKNKGVGRRPSQAASTKKASRLIQQAEIEDDEGEDDEDNDDNVEDQEDDEDDDEDDDQDDDEDDDEDGDEDDDDEEEDVDDEDDDEDEDEDESFEKQSSSDESGSFYDSEPESVDESQVQALKAAEASVRKFRDKLKAKSTSSNSKSVDLTKLLNTDDLSSDDEEATGNTVGRIPLHWYDAYDHIGYGVDGKKIEKRKGGDRIDQAIANRDDSRALRTVYDMYNDREVVLSDRDLEIIQRIQAGTFAHAEHDDTPDYVDYFSSIREVMPLSSRPEPKHKFLPSKWEMLKVKKILRAMKEGTYRTVAEREQQKRASDKPPVYMIWDESEEDILNNKRSQYHLPAPKMPLPGHAESYNPPPEYLLTAQEQADMEALDPSDRQYDFLPQKFDCLRRVPGYSNFVKERFERCLDLYLCPRKLKMRLNIDPETLVPRLPRPRELKPFPNTLCLQFLGHKKAVRSLSVSPDGQYVVSGSDDCTVRLWEVDTCLCRSEWTFRDPVLQVAWNPNHSHHIVAAVTGNRVVLIATGTGDKDSTEISDSLLEAARDIAASPSHGANKSESQNLEDSSEEEEEGDGDEDGDDDGSDVNDEKSKPVKNSNRGAKWVVSSTEGKASARSRKYGFLVGPVVELSLSAPVTSVVWHHKGDYLASLAPTAGSAAVSIHQLSKGKTQFPFTKSPGAVQAISFHPSRPFLFVATQQHVKVYHLVEQQLVKKLLSGCKWLSSVDVHPSGDHIVVGSYDRRMVWFDLDLSSTPYKTLKFHEKALRAVQYHRRYPLMASASDDGNVHIFHATVYR